MGNGLPEAFRAHNTVTNGWDCTVFPTVNLPGSDWDNFDIKNPPGNGNLWRTVLNGSVLGSEITMPFSSALGWTNGEQYGGGENESASFQGLQVMGEGGGWTDWGNAQCQYHNANDSWDSQMQTPYTWIRVTYLGSAC